MKGKIEKKKLEGFDIEIKTFIPIEEQSAICSLAMESDNFFERRMKVVVGVFCAVVDEEESNKNYTYNDIVSSGLWDAIYNELYVYVNEIADSIRYYSSLEYQVSRGLDILSTKLTELSENMPSLDKVIEAMQNENVDKAEENDG